MQPTPPSVKLCHVVARLLAYFAPSHERQSLLREWQGQIWHRWHVLRLQHAWSWREDCQMLLSCFRLLPTALNVWWLRDDTQTFIRKWFGSPWATIAGLLLSLLLVAVASGGLPATWLLFTANSPANSRELFILWHPGTSGGVRPLPADLVPAWQANSRTLESVAPFVISREHARSPLLTNPGPLVISTTARLFDVLQVSPLAGKFPKQLAGEELRRLAPSEQATVVIDYGTAQAISHRTAKVLGSQMFVGREAYRVVAVLPQKFQFLTRQPLAFLVEQTMVEPSVMVVARTRPGISKQAINRELVKIAEEKTYTFLASQLRLQFQRDAIMLPLLVFGMAALGSALLTVAVCGLRMRETKRNWTGVRSRWALRRILYFVAKTVLGLGLVCISGLELSRFPGAILLASRDPANGPFLLWLYIAGTMAILFLSVADSRRRCRHCLRWLVSPVRVGSPGSLLLNWSGTELICSKGHGVLHVPHMTTSWDGDSQQWITMDESWQELFAQKK